MENLVNVQDHGAAIDKVEPKNRLRRPFHNFDKSVLVIGSIVIIILIGYLDYVSQMDYSLYLLYMLPIALTAWFVHRDSALFLSLLSAIVWYGSDALAGHRYSLSAIAFWNIMIRLVLFATIALFLPAIRKTMERERELSRTDFSTGLTNSRAFYQLAVEELSRQRSQVQPFTLAFVDIDNFKRVNDQFGHRQGDEALKAVADVMRGNLRSRDIVARMGGDEFIILLPDTGIEAGKAVLTKLQVILIATMQQNDWDITFSIGVVTCNQFIQPLDDIIRKADELMYAVKSHGKNDIRFHSLD